MVRVSLLHSALINQRVPYLIRLTKGTPSPLVRRSLIQIAKIIQALANMNRPIAKVIERLMFIAHFVSTYTCWLAATRGSVLRRLPTPDS